jgi:hypothetical protein
MSNNDPRFGKIAKDCREANVPFPEKLVERFERVAKKLNEDWGKPAAAEYLHDLIFPSRPGRRGFPPEVAEELLAIKTLHEERYTFLTHTVWDPFDAMMRDKGKKEEVDRAGSQETNRTGQQTSEPSIYKSRKASAEMPAAQPPSIAAMPATQAKFSAMVAQLLPETVRKLLTQIRAARAQSGLTVTIAAPESELDELLVDAESLLEEQHFNSGTAILEQITTLFPDESPFGYLRLMEIYHLMGRPDDFEWVNQRLGEQFDCPRVAWVAQHAQFMVAIDRIAESFLVAMRR